MMTEPYMSLQSKRRFTLWLVEQRETGAGWAENSLVIVKLKVNSRCSCQAKQHVDSLMGHSGVASAFTNKFVSLMANYE